MCKCNPNIRTPWCHNCHHTNIPRKPPYDGVVDKLKETLEMLEYSHITGEWAYDNDKVSKFIEDMYKFTKGG